MRSSGGPRRVGEAALRLGAVLALAGAASACSTPPLFLGCRRAEDSAVSDSLYLGSARPDGVVTDPEWNAFVTQEVASRFRTGFTTTEGFGHWQSADGGLVRERTRILVILHPDDRKNEEAIQAIVDAYRERFEQEAVLRVRSRACVSLSRRDPLLP